MTSSIVHVIIITVIVMAAVAIITSIIESMFAEFTIQATADTGTTRRFVTDIEGVCLEEKERYDEIVSLFLLVKRS